MKRSRTYAHYAAEAARLLGQQIELARRERRWTIRELAERAGTSMNTIRKVEQGDMTVAIGIAFDVAALLAVPLFHEDPVRVATERELVQARLAVLPRRTRPVTREVDDDF
jgi:transcriptional regulator with XRE-family HTH domain